MPRAHIGELAALITACCWTVSALSFESAGKRVGSLAVNLFRLPIAFALLSVYSLAVRGLPLPLDAPAHAWLWLSLSGFAGFVIGDLFLFRSFIVIGARLAMLIMTLVPPVTALLSRLFLNERLSALSFAGMAVTLGGIGLAVLGSPSRNKQSERRRPLSGVLLALVAVFGQGSGLVLSKYGMGSYDAFSSTQIRGMTGIAGFCLLFFILKAWPRALKAFKDRPAMTGISLGSFFGPFLGVSLSLLALQNTSAGVASTIMAIVPILIIPPSVILFKEKVNVLEVTGAMLAVAGVAVFFFAK